MSYAQFLATKAKRVPDYGTDIDRSQIHSNLYGFQTDIVQYAVRKGRGGIWTTTGTGKSRIQLEWCRHSGETSLIVAPLAVCHQTIREARAIDLDVSYVRRDEEITGPGVWITNHERVGLFDPGRLDAVALDEGSILRDSVGKRRTQLIKHFEQVPHRISCTATPRPNDAEELTNQAEFLGIASRANMLATYFVHDSDEGWQLKGHARAPMFKWMATWAIALRRPSDMGYPDDGFILPGLEIIPELVSVDVVPPDGQLFAADVLGVGGHAALRRSTLDARCKRAAELVDAEPGQQWLLWTGLNAEADLLTDMIPGAVNVYGSLSPEEKAERLLAFADGEIPVLVTKPSIASRGLNWQNCCRMAFVGLSYSYEDYFQAIRRCYRHGQKNVVHAHIVLSELESKVSSVVARKEREADGFMAELVSAMRRARAEWGDQWMTSI